MKVNKLKTVEVELDTSDVMEAIKQFAIRSHPSCKKAESANVIVDAVNGVDGATATFTFAAKERA